jgi:uncharacterized membrane protein YeaQ/YmgE (transglycosylase-associated protein family)
MQAIIEEAEMNLLLFLVIGALAGWIAGMIMKGRGFGLLGNVAVGVVGAFLGGWLIGLLGFWPGGGLLAELVTAVVGAVVLLFVIGLVKKA